MSATGAEEVEIRLPSRLGFEKIAMSTAATMAQLAGFSPDRIEDLKTAVAEACINAIEHGNGGESPAPVGIVLSLHPGELEVKVIDNGTGMQTPVSLQAPDIARKISGEEAARGMGMFLIRTLVDEAEWVPSSVESKSFVRLVIRMDKENV